ncbi:MAG: hypothetical protein EOO10_09185 [Chitinophagaceae bacterium]|nr:MAG: hypothetical protein EOO10_09185 [Chitinophagaceae bacterium]
MTILLLSPHSFRLTSTFSGNLQEGNYNERRFINKQFCDGVAAEFVDANLIESYDLLMAFAAKHLPDPEFGRSCAGQTGSGFAVV